MGIVSVPSVEAVATPPARPSAPPTSQSGRFVVFGAALAVGVGLLSLVGWVFHISVLKSGLPGLVQIKAITVIGLILPGVALWLRRNENEQTPGRVLAPQILAGVAAGIGMFSFGEYLFGLGLMAPVNALNFCFLGLALVLLDWSTLREVWPSQVLSFAAALLSLFNLLDFLVAPGPLHTYTSLPAQSPSRSCPRLPCAPARNGIMGPRRTP